MTPSDEARRRAAVHGVLSDVVAIELMKPVCLSPDRGEYTVHWLTQKHSERQVRLGDLKGTIVWVSPDSRGVHVRFDNGESTTLDLCDSYRLVLLRSYTS